MTPFRASQTLCRPKGYTLIEVLVALLIFAIVASMTGGILYEVLNTRERVNATANVLNGLERAFLRISQDMVQFVPRTVQDLSGAISPEIVGQHGYVEFTRDGVQHVDSAVRESTLARVGYLCMDGTLIRRHFLGMDSPNRQQFEDRVLLRDLKTCYFEYLSSYNQFLPEWRVFFLEKKRKVLAIPKGVKVVVEPAHWGVVSRLFLFPGGVA